ncbi:hypothetical protein BDA96_02G177300 [Sorghum bicolor]|uniref:Uncharacterized protein n=2 Tax=Sorghum bicolor TaxID=4558 RepID=A0A921RP41_SORBI|nr:hypothetical protein BDA96_02G177300 [Sorghum bicolor]OQU89282.1 hypothetical protein SORBI_3002G168750 [Sorghum bicolor]
MMMKASASFLPSLPPRTYGAPPPSMSAARSKTSSAARSSSKPLSGGLLGHLSSKMDEASMALKDVPQRLLDVLVDATF